MGQEQGQQLILCFSPLVDLQTHCRLGLLAHSISPLDQCVPLGLEEVLSWVTPAQLREFHVQRLVLPPDRPPDLAHSLEVVPQVFPEREEIRVAVLPHPSSAKEAALLVIHPTYRPHSVA